MDRQMIDLVAEALGRVERFLDAMRAEGWVVRKVADGTIVMTRPEQDQGEKMEERLLRSEEVARLFRVDPKTVSRWVAAGKIESIRTPGGRHRFAESQVRKLMADRGMKSDVIDALFTAIPS